MKQPRLSASAASWGPGSLLSALGLTATLLLAGSLPAQDSAAAAPAVVAPSRALVPFAPGEHADYQVKFGMFSVGRGSMDVIGLDTVRGRETWHILFRIRGGVPGYRVDDRMESWMDTQTLASLRFKQDMNEGSRERERNFEIYPGDRFVEDNREPQPTVALPLDDGSFLYFVRTIPLEVGKEYVFEQYFRPDRNPVRIQVLRKERIKVPAGQFETIVIRPIIKARGVFSEDGRAEIWLTDDENRLMVQMKSHMKFGSLSLFLRSYTPGKKLAADSTALAKQ
jgi:hypothetical protein